MKLAKYKHTSETSYALGATLVAELLKTHPELITRVFLRPTEKRGDDLNQIIANLEKRHIEIIESTKAFNILGAKDNCLLAAEFKKPNQSQTGSARIILVYPSDAGNLGTIMRSAAAFGYDNLTIVTPAVDPYDPKVIRASMGAVFHLNVTQINNYDNLNLEAPSYAFLLNPDAVAFESLAKTDAKPTLIFGNEAAGLPDDFVAKTGATPVYINQSKNVDSLNLAVAASIAMHYFAN